jgi:hypothetical protein
MKTLLLLILLSIWVLIVSVWYGIADYEPNTHTIEMHPVTFQIETYGDFDASAPGGSLYLIEGGRRVDVTTRDIERMANGG